jgi:predicted O-linked N-acetylglucosamine transferase (SPINDLY family)
MATVNEAFQAAYAHHQAGQLREAEALYRQILAADPNHAESWHLLGLVAHQVGRGDMAQQWIGRAIALDGGQAVFHSNLGNVFRAARDLNQAEISLRRALQLDPQFADAYNNLGNVYLDRGQADAAADAYRQAIRLREGFPEPHNNLGTLLHARGQLDEAIEHYQYAIRANPRYVDAFNNLGTALKAQNRLDEAADAYRQALRLAPQLSSAHLNLGTIHQAQDRLDDAIACYREVLRLDPRSALAENNLGAAFKEQRHLDEAIAAYRRAIALQPQLADAHFNLGVAWQAKHDDVAAASAYRQALACNPKFAKALVNLGRIAEQTGCLDEALDYFERAVAADPMFAGAHFNRAGIYESLNRLAEAAAGYERAIALQPDFAEAYNSLAMLSSDHGKSDQAIVYCRQGLEHEPDSPALHANLATALTHQGRQAEALVESRRAVELRPESYAEFSNLLYSLNFMSDYDPQTLFEEHLEWARRHAEPLTAAATPLTNDRTPDRRLRVGYVSPYFREHAVNFFTEPLITAHDHNQFEIFCYSDNRRNDGATARLKAAADHWRDVRFLTDPQFVERVREDQIDILIDLTGHLALHRLLAFARRAAPVQVTYIGYQNTTGMSAMDYRLTDERADPSGQTDRFHTEKLARLPRSYFCYRPADNVPKVTALPALAAGHVTFGSFNNFTKVTPQVIETWLEILQRVPRSRLLVLAGRGGYVQEHFERVARAHGVDPARIELFDRMPRDKYYELLQQADIALDPFPFNGHTTTCDAVWLGLPVVMLAGETYASRFGSGVLVPVGLEELVTRSIDSYVERAVELASDVEHLASLRQELRGRMAASVLLDFSGFARDVEASYREMWIQWCAQT